MSNEEVSIRAVIQPGPKKLDRLKELMASAMQWSHDHEPETLEFSLYEESTPEGGAKKSMFERYANHAAMEAHESTDNYRIFFQKMQEEALLLGAPTISKGTFVRAFRR